MNTSFDCCSLFLYPIDRSDSTKQTQTRHSALIPTMHDIGFIADRIDTQEDTEAYTAGDRFLDHITYLGCAPTIQFEPGENGDRYCYVRIRQYQQKELIVNKTQARPPRCPNCNRPITNWQRSLDSAHIQCDQCQHISDIGTLDWRKMGGYARLFIEVTDIFPKEAVPQPTFLDVLKKNTCSDWSYFYSCR